MEFLDAVQAGRALDASAAVQLVGQCGTIQNDVEGPHSRSEDSPAVRTLGDTWNGPKQIHYISSVQGQLLNTRSVQRMGQRSRICGDHRSEEHTSELQS